MKSLMLTKFLIPRHFELWQSVTSSKNKMRTDNGSIECLVL